MPELVARPAGSPVAEYVRASRVFDVASGATLTLPPSVMSSSGIVTRTGEVTVQVTATAPAYVPSVTRTVTA